MSFTFDAWTSEIGEPFLSITGHYIDIPADAPHDQPQTWTLKGEQLAFAPFEGKHTGVNMAGVIMRVIDRYGLRSKVCIFCFNLLSYLTLLSLKVGWFTADSARNNDTCIKAIGEIIDPGKLSFDPRQRRIR